MLLQLNVIPTDYRVCVPKPRTKQMCASVSVAFLPSSCANISIGLCDNLTFWLFSNPINWCKSIKKADWGQT